MTPTTSPPSESPNARLLVDARGFVYRVRSVACLVTGSSFATSQGIVTNRHVAGGSSSLELSTWNGTDFNANVDAISDGPDLAVMSGTPAQGMPEISTPTLKAGTPVWAAGYPLGDQLTVTPGKVIGYVDGAQFGEPGQIMEITNAIKHGNSGGPLLDSRGNVVGVVFALDMTNNHGLAIPASTLSQFLSSPGNSSANQCVNDSGSGSSGSGSSGPGPVDVGPVAGSPLASAVQETLAAYFGGIDSRDFPAAYAAYSPRLRASFSESSFASEDQTSTISGISVSTLNEQGNGDVVADVTFTSLQAPQDGPVPGQSCTNWSLAYSLIPATSSSPPSYLIDSVMSIGAGHTAC